MAAILSSERASSGGGNNHADIFSQSFPSARHTPSCWCCPYGYHIDLDFVQYCEELTQNASTTPAASESQRQRRDRRRQRKSMEVMLGFEQIAELQKIGIQSPLYEVRCFFEVLFWFKFFQNIFFLYFIIVLIHLGQQRVRNSSQSINWPHTEYLHFWRYRLHNRLPSTCPITRNNILAIFPSRYQPNTIIPAAQKPLAG